MPVTKVISKGISFWHNDPIKNTKYNNTIEILNNKTLK